MIILMAVLGKQRKGCQRQKPINSTVIMLHPSGHLISWAKFKDIQHSEVLCICDWQWHIGCWIQEATGHDIMMMNTKSEKGLMPRIIVIILFIIVYFNSHVIGDCVIMILQWLKRKLVMKCSLI